MSLHCLLLAGCAQGIYSERAGSRDPYGIDVRAAQAKHAGAVSGERRMRTSVLVDKTKSSGRPAKLGHPVLAEVDKALAKVAPAQQVVAAAGQAVTESSLIVSSANPDQAVRPPIAASVATQVALPDQRASGSQIPRTAAMSKLVEQGRALFRSGQVVRARERFIAALVELVPGRLPDVLPDLARTYDPLYLQQLPKSDVVANPAMALAIYQRAAMIGSKDASAEIARLQDLQR